MPGSDGAEIWGSTHEMICRSTNQVISMFQSMQNNAFFIKVKQPSLRCSDIPVANQSEKPRNRPKPWRMKHAVSLISSWDSWGQWDPRVIYELRLHLQFHNSSRFQQNPSFSQSSNPSSCDSANRTGPSLTICRQHGRHGYHTETFQTFQCRFRNFHFNYSQCNAWFDQINVKIDSE